MAENLLLKYPQFPEELKIKLRDLLDKEERYEVIFNHTSEGILVAELNSKIFYFANPSICKMLGYTREELLQMRVFDIHPKEDLDYVLQEFEAQARNQKELAADIPCLRKDGTVFYCDIKTTSAEIQGITYNIGLFIDITRHRLEEAALRESEERFKIAGKASYDLLYEWDVKNDTLEWFGDIDTLLGFETGEISRNISSWLKLIHPDDVELLADAVEIHRESTKPINYDYRIQNKNGTFRYWNDHALPLLDENKKPYKWIGVCTDITERKKTVEDLIESRERFRNLAELLPEIVFETDINNILTYANRKGSDLFGYSHKDISEGLQAESLIIQEDRERVKKNFIKRLKGIDLGAQEYTGLRKNGSTFPILLHTAPIFRDGQLIGSRGIVIDITESKRSGKEIQRMQRLEGLSTIAGGIAHDFNNLLMGIFGNLDLANFEIPEDSEIKEYLDNAFKALENARKLTGQLLTFAKGGTPELEIIDTKSIIKETVQFHLHGSNINPLYYLPDDLWPMKADRGQIGQVIANLTINAREAMPNGGEITIKANNVKSSEVNDSYGISGDFIQLIIQDVGHGIPSTIIEKIFDPYFTTKQTGHGLGLSVVYSIIKQHNGHIFVNSKENEGSTFTLFIPAIPNVQIPEKQEKGSIFDENLKQNLKILLMDDEKMIRDIGVKMLERLGYEVDIAVEGNEAIEKYSNALKNGNSFDLIIMDLTIPNGKGGKEAIKDVLEIDPHAHVIVSSGYASDPILANYKKYGFCGKLEKPFLMKELKEEIIRVMKQL